MLSAAIETATTKGFEQIFVLLEKMLMQLNKSGYGITINDVNNGNVIIGDSNQSRRNYKELACRIAGRDQPLAPKRDQP